MTGVGDGETKIASADEVGLAMTGMGEKVDEMKAMFCQGEARTTAELRLGKMGQSHSTLSEHVGTVPIFPKLMFGGMMRLMCYEVGKNGDKDSGSEERENSVDHVCTPFDIKKLKHKKAMNKINPVNANAALKLDAKNDAKVNATSERLAKSIAFSLYNLRWNSFISIVDSIAHAHSLSREVRKNGTVPFTAKITRWDSPYFSRYHEGLKDEINKTKGRTLKGALQITNVDT